MPLCQVIFAGSAVSQAGEKTVPIN
jgi:hypothetical protein